MTFHKPGWTLMHNLKNRIQPNSSNTPRTIMRSTTLYLLVSLLCSFSRAADWPQFRGPDGQGHSNAEGIPIQWSETENIAWKTAIPGEGWSSPVIWGNQIWMKLYQKIRMKRSQSALLSSKSDENHYQSDLQKSSKTVSVA